MYVLTAALGVFGLLTQRWLGTACMLLLVVLGITRPEYIPLHPDWFRLAGFCGRDPRSIAQGQVARSPYGDADVAVAGVFVDAFASNALAVCVGAGLLLLLVCLPHAGVAQVGAMGRSIVWHLLVGWPLQQVLVAKMPAISMA